MRIPSEVMYSTVVLAEMEMRCRNLARLLPCILLLLPLCVEAQPSIHGELSGALGPGTYSVDGDCEVPAGETLTISPGTTFLHTGHYTWNIFGELHAAGTPSSPIVFNHVAPSMNDNWGGIRFSQGAPNTSVMEWCRLSWCRNVLSPATEGGAFYSDRVAITLRNCTIRYCSAAEGGGIYLNHADNSLIDSCTIVNSFANDGGGIQLNGCSNVLIRRCTIGGNSSITN